MALFITLFLGLFFMAGALLIKLVRDEHTVSVISIAAALGALVSMAVSDLIPDILEEYSGTGLISALIFTVLGVIILILLDHFVPEHESSNEDGNMSHIGFMSVLAISLHNIIEGMTVYSITTQSMPMGLSLAVGVGLHNIPMGMLIFTSLRKEAKSKKYFVMSLATLSTFIGGLIMLLISDSLNNSVVSALLCIALGMVIYIVFFELLPHIIHHKEYKKSIIGFILGILFVLASMLFE